MSSFIILRVVLHSHELQAETKMIFLKSCISKTTSFTLWHVLRIKVNHNINIILTRPQVILNFEISCKIKKNHKNRLGCNLQIWFLLCLPYCCKFLRILIFANLKLWKKLNTYFCEFHVLKNCFLLNLPRSKRTLRKNCPYLELFWSVFSRNRGKHGPEQLRTRTLFMQWRVKV